MLDVITGRAKVSGDVVQVAGGVNTSISGQPVLISGQTVVTSVSVSISLSGISGNIVYIANDGLHNVVWISGQPVYLVSGQNIVQNSGQTVIAKISGETIQIAGGINVSGSPVRISGETVSISGKIVIGDVATASTAEVMNQGQARSPAIIGIATGAFGYGYDSATNVWPRLRVTDSGDGNRLIVSISGQPVTATVNTTTNISGQSVRMWDSFGNALRSITSTGPAGTWTEALTVAVISGSVTQISGQFVRTSGGVTLIEPATGAIAELINQNQDARLPTQIGLVTGAFGYGYDPSIDLWRRLKVTTSGDGTRLLVSISGQPVTTTVNVTTNISGQGVRVYDTAGNTITTINSLGNPQGIWGSALTVAVISGSVSQISGQTVSITNDGVNNLVYAAILADPNNVVRISGQGIRLMGNSNANPVAASTMGGDGFDPNISNFLYTGALGLGLDSSTGGIVRLRTTTSGDGFRLIVSISGQPVTANVNTTTNISGQRVWLADYAGWPLVSILGAGAAGVWANGLTVAVISGSVTQVSGQTVKLTDVDGSALRNNFSAAASNSFWPSALMVGTTSGSVVQISGQTVNANVSVTTNISGQTVKLSDFAGAAIGTNQTIAAADRWAVSLLTATLSGSVTQISGQRIGIINDGINNLVYTAFLAPPNNVVGVSGQAVRLFDSQGNSLMDLFSMGGGAGYWLDALAVGTVSGSVTKISGQLVTVGDGVGNRVEIMSQDQLRSKLTIGLATGAFNYGYDSAADNWERLRITASGDGTRLIVSVSGQPVRVVPEGQVIIRAASGLVCTSLSGGTQLPSLSADRVTIRMDPDAVGRMYLGSTTNPPFSGMGFKLSPGDGVTLQVSGNCNAFRMFATTSGEQTFFIIEDA